MKQENLPELLTICNVEVWNPDMVLHNQHVVVRNGKIISMRPAENQEILECQVLDNGIGRKKAKILKSQQEHQHKSMALEVTQERLDILKENESGIESLRMEDIVAENGEVCGTKVTIRLPIFA